jgi:hypothetical protein
LVLGLIAGICHVLPFAGSRHQTYMLPFVAAGLSAALTWISRRLALLLVLLCLVTAPHWVAHNPPDNNPRFASIHDMKAAMVYVSQTIPRDTPVFADDETHYVLRYYLGRNDSSLAAWRLHASSDEIVGGRRIVSPRNYAWAFSGNDALPRANEAARVIGMAHGDPLWIVSVAWLDAPLASRLPAGSLLSAREFGSISVIEAARE